MKIKKTFTIINTKKKEKNAHAQHKDIETFCHLTIGQVYGL